MSKQFEAYVFWCFAFFPPLSFMEHISFYKAMKTEMWAIFCDVLNLFKDWWPDVHMVMDGYKKQE